MKNDDIPVVDNDELVDYIQNALMHNDGILVKREDIMMILSYEIDYMVENGFMVVLDDETD